MSVPKDPYMLFSFVNTKLRDDFSTLDLFCENYDEDKDDILKKLGDIGYSYDSEQNRFT